MGRTGIVKKENGFILYQWAGFFFVLPEDGAGEACVDFMMRVLHGRKDAGNPRPLFGDSNEGCFSEDDREAAEDFFSALI
jgi:hypothetical protein